MALSSVASRVFAWSLKTSPMIRENSRASGGSVLRRSLRIRSPGVFLRRMGEAWGTSALGLYQVGHVRHGAENGRGYGEGPFLAARASRLRSRTPRSAHARSVFERVSACDPRSSARREAYAWRSSARRSL